MKCRVRSRKISVEDGECEVSNLGKSIVPTIFHSLILTLSSPPLVSLARALFIQPVCLLLDEPTNHLGKSNDWNCCIVAVDAQQKVSNLYFIFRYGGCHLVGKLPLEVEAYLTFGQSFTGLSE